MSVNTQRLLTKLGAILAKDPDYIMARKPYLPFIGTNYTRQQVVDWLAARSDLLEQAKTATDAQINNRITTYYNSLGAADKLIADKIIAGQPFDMSKATNFNAYEKLVAIYLSKYVVD